MSAWDFLEFNNSDWYGAYHNGMEEYATAVPEGIAFHEPRANFKVALQAGFFQLTAPYEIGFGLRVYADVAAVGEFTHWGDVQADGSNTGAELSLVGWVNSQTEENPGTLRIYAYANQEYCNFCYANLVVEYLGRNDADNDIDFSGGF